MRCVPKDSRKFECMKLTKENEEEFKKFAEKYYLNFGDKIEFGIYPKGIESHMFEDKSPLDIFLYNYWYIFITDETSYYTDDFTIDELNDVEFNASYKILDN